MANPNRVFAHLAKNPFTLVAEFNSEWDADDMVEKLKAEGFDAKKTHRQLKKAGFSRATRTWQRASSAWAVWKREKV